VLQYEDKSELEPADYFYRIKAVNAGGESPYSLLAIVRASSIITAVEPSKDEHLVYVSGRTLIIDLNRPTNANAAVYDMSGRLRKSQVIRQNGQVDLANFPAGLYVVAIDTGREVISKRILLY
jgi:titin